MAMASRSWRKSPIGTCSPSNTLRWFGLLDRETTTPHRDRPAAGCQAGIRRRMTRLVAFDACHRRRMHVSNTQGFEVGDDLLVPAPLSPVLSPTRLRPVQRGAVVQLVSRCHVGSGFD